MAATNERKGVLHRLWSDRIAPAIRPEEQSVNHEDTSTPDDRNSAPDGERTAWRGNAGGSRQQIVTPEERILELVSEHSGRMKQGEIVSNVEWSESTVSRKLQQLESTGDVTRYQIGREKFVYLPGNEPAALESPFTAVDGDAPLTH